MSAWKPALLLFFLFAAFVGTFAPGCGGNASPVGSEFRGSTSAAVAACAPPSGYKVEQDAAVVGRRERVVVMLPTPALATSYRVFYGEPDHMVERQLIHKAFGSALRIFSFDVDGSTFTAVFPSDPNPALGSSRLIEGDEASAHETRELSILSQNTPSPDPALQFFCF